MLDFIIKYWVQFILGIIAAGLSYFVKRYYTLYQEEKKRQFDESLLEIKKLIDAREESLKQLIEETNEFSAQEDEKLHKTITALQNGILSVLKKSFLDQCDILLAPDHEITLDEFTNISHDHEVYHELGGNHEGDAKYDLICVKYKALLMSK